MEIDKLILNFIWEMLRCKDSPEQDEPEFKALSTRYVVCRQKRKGEANSAIGWVKGMKDDFVSVLFLLFPGAFSPWCSDNASAPRDAIMFLFYHCDSRCYRLIRKREFC